MAQCSVVLSDESSFDHDSLFVYKKNIIPKKNISSFLIISEKEFA